MLEQQRILIVEDEPLIAIDLQYGLEDALAEVVGPAGALRPALELAQRYGITAAIVDLQLKNEDAEPLIELLLQRRVPIVIYSGGDLHAAALRWPSATMVGKPASIERIIETLMVLLALPALQPDPSKFAAPENVVMLTT